jgi:endonuclease-3
MKKELKKSSEKSDRFRRVLKLLKKHYPDAACSLIFKNPLELLIATQLSAQCTDEMVNKVTPKLFQQYKTAKDFAGAPVEELENLIHSTGFYHNKAKNIQAACRMIHQKFDGQVPRTMEEMLELPGVARKTANVVLFNAFGILEGIAVDTHVSRVSQRLKLTREKVPSKIEKDLMKLVPQKEWGMITHYLIAHGRKICKAQNPKCGECFLNKICPYPREQNLLRERGSLPHVPARGFALGEE